MVVVVVVELGHQESVVVVVVVVLGSHMDRCCQSRTIPLVNVKDRERTQEEHTPSLRTASSTFPTADIPAVN